MGKPNRNDAPIAPPLTDLQKTNLRLTSVEIAIKYGTKLGFERDVCLREAEKIYNFALGQSADEAAPIAS